MDKVITCCLCWGRWDWLLSPGYWTPASVVIRNTLTGGKTFIDMHRLHHTCEHTFHSKLQTFSPQLWSVEKPRAGDSRLTTSKMGVLHSRGKSHGISLRQSSCSGGGEKPQEPWTNTVISTLQDRPWAALLSCRGLTCKLLLVTSSGFDL